MPTHSTAHPLKIAIFVSGQSRGSNMQSLIEDCKSELSIASVGVVIGTRSDSRALERARESNIQTTVVSPIKKTAAGNVENSDYGATLLRILRKYDIGLICLAGYMRILPPIVVEEFENRIMNIHPALLPLFGGQGMYGENVHKAVLASGMKIAGCTVHFVDQHYDNGPIIMQTVVPVLDEDEFGDLAARVLKAEHKTYPEAVQLFAQNRLQIRGRRVKILTIALAD